MSDSLEGKAVLVTGSTSGIGNALDTTDEQWLDTMAVNVHALFYMSRAAVKHMRAAGKGVIVNVASEWGLNGEPNHAAGIPMRRLAHPIEVARCVHFLASDLSSYVTGANLSVDGGNDAGAGPYP